MASKKEHGTFRSILVVDDRTAICSLLKRVLAREGFDVRAATDGEAALNIAKSQTPGMAIVDCLLPGRVSGLEVVNTLKKMFPTTKCVLMSGSCEVVSRLSSQAPVDAVLEKPFDVGRVIDLANSLLGGNKRRMKRRNRL